MAVKGRNNPKYGRQPRRQPEEERMYYYDRSPERFTPPMQGTYRAPPSNLPDVFLDEPPMRFYSKARPVPVPARRPARPKPVPVPARRPERAGPSRPSGRYMMDKDGNPVYSAPVVFETVKRNRG